MNSFDRFNTTRVQSYFYITILTIGYSLMSMSMHLMKFNVRIYLIVGILAYVLTDFVNGIIHMIVDNLTYDKGDIGALITGFHTHHDKDNGIIRDKKYKHIHPFISNVGSKHWLAILLYISLRIKLDERVHLGLFMFGVFSIFAEYSHYASHTIKDNSLINVLRRLGVMLKPDYHMIHHDHGEYYAFLNGMTDPLINYISYVLYSKRS